MMTKAAVHSRYIPIGMYRFFHISPNYNGIKGYIFLNIDAVRSIRCCGREIAGLVWKQLVLFW